MVLEPNVVSGCPCLSVVWRRQPYLGAFKRPEKIGPGLSRIKDLCFRYYQLNTFSLHGVSCKLALLGWNVLDEFFLYQSGK